MTLPFLLQWILPINILNWGFFIPYFYVRTKYKITYIHASIPIAIYFLLACLCTFLVFPHVFISSPILFPPTTIATIVFVLFLITLVLISKTQHLIFSYVSLDEYLFHYPGASFIHLNLRFFIPKFFDIVFQQMLIVASCMSLFSLGLALPFVSLIFGILFCAGHIVMVIPVGIKGKAIPIKTSLIFCVASLVAGIIWPYILFTVPSGYVYTIIMHMSYYLILGFYTRYTIHKTITQ